MNLSKRLNIITITDSKEIKNTLDHSKKIYFKYGILFLNKDSDIKENLKFAVLVKKHCGNAVRRNYIKRISRNFVVRNIALFKPYNRVIFLFLSKEKFRYKELENQLLKALRNEKATFTDNSVL
ncbi:hypothetical protein DRI50_00245 [candidate division KSB1 bacterium]|nr:MAG: hypothetical protein DRI50_00245 [candidate division KSB1 bacterium]